MSTNHLYDGLTSYARMRPDARFAEIWDGRHYRYADIEAVSARFANALVERGVRSGDRVALQAEKSIESLMVYLAAVRAGAVFLPLNTAYTAAEIGYFLHDAEPAVFVCAPERRDELAPVAERAGARLETLGVWRSHAVSAGSLADAALATSPEFATVPREPDDLASILYTSGTTGRSKGAMLTHANLRSNAETLATLWRFTPDDVLLHALPIFHVHGLFTATNTALAAGSSLIFLPKFDVDEVIRRLPQTTAMMGVPTFYTRLLEHPGLAAAARNVRVFISGSAPLLAETHRRFQEVTGHVILERYGMTETGMNTSNPYEGERRAGTVGLPLPGVELRITDPDTGAPVAAGEIGMIEVRGPNVFAGYWRMPEKTREEMRADGFFITGDLGLIDDDGTVTIVGRGKDLVITGGYNVYPKEIETEIDGIPGVVESAVIGLPHADFGEAVTAVVVAEPDAGLTEADVHAALKDKLAKFKQPKRVLFAEALPRNTMGKVQKNVLRERHADLYV